MTSMNHIVVDVSSEEEDDAKRVEGFMEVSDEKPKSTDLLNLMVKNEDCDDDCVILDFDPTAKDTAVETCETDEVLVVGQKGEIACRDFPHPRHDCAKYPFRSTLHQLFCEMCHCYVCDTRAPCPYWFTGFSVLDHCHASDKEQTWKNQRECVRTRNTLPLPVSKPASTILQFNRFSQPQSIPLPQNSSTPVTQFGTQACSTAIRAATHLNTYTIPGYRTSQSINYPQNLGSQTLGVQSLPNNRGGVYNGNPIPHAVASHPCVWTQRPSKGDSRPQNCVQNIVQGSKATCYTPPMAAEGNAQRIVTGYISTLPVSHSREYARHFNRNMHSGNLQTNEVPSMTPIIPENQQQQQSGISNDKVLSEFEEWLLDDSPLSYPLFGQDNASTVAFDFETILND